MSELSFAGIVGDKAVLKLTKEFQGHGLAFWTCVAQSLRRHLDKINKSSRKKAAHISSAQP